MKRRIIEIDENKCNGARLLIAADCTAYAYAAFHERFIKGHITLVGCPKPGSVDYSEKLTESIRSNDIRSVTIVRMEVPCCGGLESRRRNGASAERGVLPFCGRYEAHCMEACFVKE